MTPISLYSLHSLASMSRSATTSRVLLESVVERLHHQISSDFLIRSYAANDTLGYIHRDTCRLAEQLLENPRPWQRSSNADRHTIQSIFAEISARHSKTIERVVELVEADPDSHASAEQFLRQRQGIQLLCHHHTELEKERPGGAVRRQLRINDIVDEAIVESSHVVDAHLLTCPPVNVHGTIQATTIRSWLQHSLVELLKNAMAATVQQHGASLPELPAIEIHLQTTNQMTTIEIVDSGTGIRDEQKAFRIGHTSQRKHWDRLDEQQSYAAVRSPLSSLGVGLSVARHQSEHFGGSLSLVNNTSSQTGCTARLLLPVDETLLEQLPSL